MKQESMNTVPSTPSTTPRLSPFFCYYGGKWRAAPKYPTPTHNVIVEPFAGAAGYATRYPDRQVILVEKDPSIAALWRYLIQVSAEEIRGLPGLPSEGQSTDDMDIAPEARTLIGFWLNKGTAHACKTPSAWARGGTHPNSFWGSTIRERIASQLEAIRHWTILEGSYEQAPDLPATWYVDPPYQVAGKHYRCKSVDYTKLSEWCQSRPGQVIVCENEGADWLPFRRFADIKSNPSSRGKSYSAEVIWTKD